VTKPGYSASLGYGATGARIRRTETGSALARYPSPRLELRGGQVYRLLRTGGSGAVIAEVEGPAGAVRSYALLRDGAMNAGHVVRTAGGASALEGPPRRWKAFGTLRTGSSALERGYASQAQEGATGLVLMGARHYDPATGRFLQPDPLGIEAGELYAYAASNPYVYWDPTGLTIQSFAADAWSGVSGFLGDPTVTGALQDIGTGLGMAAASVFVPWAGETMDAYTLQDPGAASWEKGLAAGSLALGVWTAGASPNASGVLRGGRQVASGFGDLAAASGDLVGFVSREADDLLRYVHPNNWDAALGRPTSGAFRGSEVSVFSTAEGATPEAVLRAMNAPAGSKVVAVPRTTAEGLVEIRRSPGATGDAVLDSAHYDLLNVSKSPARKLAETCRVVGGC
jgi:RHS repeat-associated protein